MKSFWKRTAIELEDWLRYSPAVRAAIGRWMRFRDAWRSPRDHQARARSIRDLCAAARMTFDPATLRAINERIHVRLAEMDPRQVDWTEFVSQINEAWMPRAVFVKPWLGPNERGILFATFEVEWIKLLRFVNLEEFAARYTLIVAPTSAPFNLVNYAFPAAYPQPLFSLINHEEDVEIIPRISAKYRMIPLYTSHWVNPENYHPRPRNERDIDLIMVAAWGKVKRHHALWQALRTMPAPLKIVLIGQDQDGRTVESIQREASYYGVAGRFEVMTNAPHPEVLEKLCRAKVSVLLSLREGSAVIVPESLFADTPVALYHDAYNGSRSFINADTGRLLQHAGLGEQLMQFLADADRCRARAWAEEHITCFRSSATMNAILKNQALADGQAWTQDIFPMCWRPYPLLVNPADDVHTEPDRRWMLERFGLKIGP